MGLKFLPNTPANLRYDATPTSINKACCVAVVIHCWISENLGKWPNSLINHKSGLVEPREDRQHLRLCSMFFLQK